MLVLPEIAPTPITAAIKAAKATKEEAAMTEEAVTTEEEVTAEARPTEEATPTEAWPAPDSVELLCSLLNIRRRQRNGRHHSDSGVLMLISLHALSKSAWDEQREA